MDEFYHFIEAYSNRYHHSYYGYMLRLYKIISYR